MTARSKALRIDSFGSRASKKSKLALTSSSTDRPLPHRSRSFAATRTKWWLVEPPAEPSTVHRYPSLSALQCTSTAIDPNLLSWLQLTEVTPQVPSAARVHSTWDDP